MTYHLVKVPLDRVRDAWPSVSPHLETVIAVAPNELTLEGLLNRILAEEEDLMTVIDATGRLVAAFTLIIKTMDTGKKILVLPILGGSEITAWMDDIFPQFEPIAIAEGCYQVRATGARPGFAKIFKRYRNEVTVRHDISINI